MSLCSKPGCQGAAAAVLSYDYSSRSAVLDDPQTGMVDPHIYVLCARCADKLSPPRGWDLDDRREKPPLFLARGAATTTVAVHEVVGEDIVPQAEPDRGKQLFFGSSAGA